MNWLKDKRELVPWSIPNKIKKCNDIDKRNIHNICSSLTFVLLINDIPSAAFKMLNFIIRNCRSLNNPQLIKTLCFEFVRSRLKYGTMI